jgi:hypothetical protein
LSQGFGLLENISNFGIQDKWVGEGEYRIRQSESEKADTDSDPDSDAEYLLKILLSKTLCDALDCVLKGHRST